MINLDHETRKRAGRFFGLIALAGLVLWGARVYQNAYPLEFQVRYVYDNLPDAPKLKEVKATLTQKGATISTIRFFHPTALSEGAENTSRQQRVRAPRGPLRVYVLLTYSDGTKRQHFRKLDVRESGGEHRIYLKYAKRWKKR